MLGNIFIISKNLTTTYNNYIMEKLDYESELDNKISYFLYNLIQNNVDETFLFDNFLPLLNNNSKIIPLYDEEVDLKNVISYIGYESLHDLIQLYDIKNELTQTQHKIIVEINKVFIPMKTNFFQVINHSEDYFWRIPTKFLDNDLLQLNRELWIKYKNNEYLKIEGYFINDSLSCLIKTSQLNYTVIDKLKSDIYTELKESLIDSKFIKKFIRYDYLGNIYTLSSKEYVKILETYYDRYMEITGASFVNIMKDFINTYYLFSASKSDHFFSFTIFYYEFYKKQMSRSSSL
jgi:hypothetical protein